MRRQNAAARRSDNRHQHRILDAVKRLFRRESHVQPLLVLSEDLHWIDAESQALLDGLMESLPTARLLLVVTYRPEYLHAWGSKTYYTQLRIDPFPPESADALLTAILGPHESLESLTRVLIERTDGNPFFLEETVQTLVETKVLVGDRGAYRLTTERDPWPVRATAQAILAARIDRLSPEHKRLLQAASVIGRDVPFTLLGAIAPTCPRNACAAGSASSRRPSSSTRRPSSRTSSTRSSTPIQRVAFSVGSVSARRRRRLHFVHTQTVFTTAVVGVVALVVGWVSA